MNGVVAGVIAWLREPVSSTGIRWELLNVASLLLGEVLAVWACMTVGEDLAIIHRQHRNGATRRMARASVRREALRLARIGLWLLLFLGFLFNWQYQIALVAFIPMLYALVEAADLLLDRVMREGIRRYFLEAEQRAHADAALAKLRRRLLEEHPEAS